MIPEASLRFSNSLVIRVWQWGGIWGTRGTASTRGSPRLPDPGLREDNGQLLVNEPATNRSESVFKST